MNIIALPLFGIGDAIMTTPALRNIKELTGGGAKVTFLHMFRATKEILDNNPYIDENIHFPFLETSRLKGLKFLLGLRGKYDVSINFYPSNRKDYNLASFIVGCPVRIGHRYVLRDVREMNYLKNRTCRENDSLHNVEENLRLLEFIGLKKIKPYPLEVYLTDAESAFAGQWLKDRGIGGESPLAGFHPGSSVFKEHAKKRWPSDKFSTLIGELSRSYSDMRFLLFGGREEYPLNERIRLASGVGEKVFIVETDSIRQTAAIMSNCRVFTANDSGLMHLSAALQVPTVAIFGPTNPVWLAPWKCRHKVISLGQCGPCFRYSPIPQTCYERQDFSCMRDIGVESVLEAAVSLLS